MAGEGEDKVAPLKDEGNANFNRGDYHEAIGFYTKALVTASEQIGKIKEENQLTLYKNRAAAYLKLGLTKNALNDCTAALELNSQDAKALFRRCQALEQLEKFDEAYKDAKELHNIDPKNKAIQPVLARLHAKLQEMAKTQSSTNKRVEQMFDLVFGGAASGGDQQSKQQAANNLVVLSRDKAGAEMMFKNKIVPKILGLMKTERDPEIITACIRTLGELCKGDVERTRRILAQVTIAQMIEGLNSKLEVQVNAAQHAVQIIFDTFSGMDLKEEKKADKKLLEENRVEIDGLMKTLTHAVSSYAMSANGRDAIIELIMRNVSFTALNWGEKLLETDGIGRLLEVASVIDELKLEPHLETTRNTRTLVAIALQHIYDSLSADMYREQFRVKVDDFIKDKLLSPETESKIRVTAAIGCLLQGAVDVGNYCIGQQGILEMMLVMAGTDDPIQQMVSAEALIAASGKKDKCSSILSQGVNILKKLYQSNNDSIRVRGLVGLCKLGSMGGSDSSIRPFADGSSHKLSEACIKLLLNPSKDGDIRKWAAEGLSYLTLDAEVKEELVSDKAAVNALVELAKTGGETVLYGVVTTFVNLTNCYDKQEIIPELIQLAKFSKQHVPEEHALDSRECTGLRIKKLTELGMASALVALSKTESANSKELISRIFNAICEQTELRGIVVQAGGAKALLPMALDGTDKGKIQAAQALSRITISINPEVALPGQRCAEVVRPILQLLHPDCSGLENFEALLALCNLARVSETVRKNLIKDVKFDKIETYMYEDHEMIKRAATQCMVNLIFSDEMIKYFEGPNDRVKYWTLLCMEEDYETAKAAAGGLAMLTEASKKCCRKVFEANAWLDSLRYLLVNECPEMQYRGACIVSNMMNASKSVAEKLVDTDITELLMAISKLEDPKYTRSRDVVAKTLVAAEKWKLIEKNRDGDDDTSD
uniref:Protein unc-45 homolog B n=1 Tax=Strigamia maritima TaxID=126957 RepID=T1JCZ1_STRMM